MCRGNICNQTMCRLSNAAELFDIPRLVRAHLQNRNGVVILQLEEGKGKSNMSIEIPLCGVHIILGWKYMYE